MKESNKKVSSGQPEESYPVSRSVVSMESVNLTLKQEIQLKNSVIVGIYKQLKTKGLLTDGHLKLLISNITSARPWTQGFAELYYNKF